MEVDWDEALEDAEDSPRGLLSELIQRADEIDEIVVVFLTGASEGREQTNVWQNTRHQSMTIALLEYASWCEKMKMYEGKV